MFKRIFFLQYYLKSDLEFPSIFILFIIILLWILRSFLNNREIYTYGVDIKWKLILAVLATWLKM